MSALQINAVYSKHFGEYKPARSCVEVRFFPPLPSRRPATPAHSNYLSRTIAGRQTPSWCSRRGRGHCCSPQVNPLLDQQHLRKNFTAKDCPFVRSLVARRSSLVPALRCRSHRFVPTRPLFSHRLTCRHHTQPSNVLPHPTNERSLSSLARDPPKSQTRCGLTVGNLRSRRRQRGKCWVTR